MNEQRLLEVNRLLSAFILKGMNKEQIAEVCSAIGEYRNAIGSKDYHMEVYAKNKLQETLAFYNLNGFSLYLLGLYDEETDSAIEKAIEGAYE